MNKEAYKKMVDELTPKESRLKNFLVAFFVGGGLGLFSEVFLQLIIRCFSVSYANASSYLCLFIIFSSAFCTALGFFDNWVSKFKAGLILPTTGFAHSVAASILDYKHDGAVTGLGSNVFKLAGSVILYGIVFSFLFVLLWVFIYG